MEYKNLKTYKNFLTEKYKLILEGDNTEKEINEEEDLKKVLVKDPNNPLDQAINSTLERLKKKTDVYVKDDEGKQIYTAYQYRQLKMVDLEEIIIKKKNEYFLNTNGVKTGEDGHSDGENTENTQGQPQGQGQGQPQGQNESRINEGWMKKLFDYAVKKTKLYASKIKAAKKLDPVFEEAEKEIGKLFEDKKNIDAFKKANSDEKELQAKLETEMKEIKTELDDVNGKLEDALNKNAQAEKGENAFKEGEIFSYKNSDNKEFRVVVVKTEPLEVAKVSTSDKEKAKDEEPLNVDDIVSDEKDLIKPNKDGITKIGEDNIKKVQDQYKDDIEKVKNNFNINTQK